MNIINKIKLIDEKALKWHHLGNARVKGYGWIDGKLYEKESLAALIDTASNLMQLKEIMQRLNGCYAGCVEIDDRFCVFVDHIGSIPMFYDVEHGMVSDRADFIEEIDLSIDPIAVAEVAKTTMFACNERTFSKTTKQLLPGEIICIADNGSVEYVRYHSHYNPGENEKNSYEEYLEEIDEVTTRVFERLIESLHGQTAIVPLSGGYDSRFIVAMLRKLNYENVVCYTYGFSDDTYETGISRKVAEQLGYRHFWVKTDEKLWQNFFVDAEVQNFLNYGYHHSNFPHVQEIMALQMLRQDPEFPKEGVVLPGFCADLFGGSYTLALPQNMDYRYDKELLVQYIFEKNFFVNDRLNKYDAEIKEDISAFMDRLAYRIDDLKSFDSANMEWFIEHKVAHFILPCIKTFEFFGYTWRLPFWDKELVDFWFDIPMKYKQDNSLYDYSLMKLYFEPLGVDFRKEKGKLRRYIKGTRNKWLHNALYGIIMSIYYHTGYMIYFRKESNNFDYLCRLGYQKMKNKNFIYFPKLVRFETLSYWWLEKKIGADKMREIMG